MKIIPALALLVGITSSSGAADWKMLYGTPHRNNVSSATDLPTDFDVNNGTNITWKAKLGSQSYGNTIVADGQIYVGTNNGNGFLRRFPPTIDLGCLVCFRQSDGEFLWQFSARKLPTGRVHDWPLQGICSAPYVEGDRMWFVSSRGEVICLDTKGYYDGEDDGLPSELETSSKAFVAINDLRWSAVPEEKELRELRWQTLESLVRGHANELIGPFTKQINHEDGSWKFTFPNAQTAEKRQKVYELRFDWNRVRIIESVSPRQYRTTSYPARLTEWIERGMLSQSLVDLFKSRGIAVAKRSIVETVEKDRKWKLRGVERDTELEFELTLDDNVLTCMLAYESDDHLKEADVVWSFDMMGQLGVSQHNMATCSPLVHGDLLFLHTSNGLDQTHLNLPAPDAPSFIAMNKNTGEVVWTDNSPGTNILHGQWSCPALGVFDGVPQVIYPGGDGWIYSFHAEQWKDGQPILLWKFDGNPKDSKWVLGGSGTRNNAIALPVIYEQKVYIVMGQDPEHGEGPGHLWCIDPTKRGDISEELAVDDTGQVLPPRRLQASDAAKGETAIPNPNSGVVWHFHEQDANGDGKTDYEEEMHRSMASPTIKDDLLYIGDFSGIFYCLDANTGKLNWTHDQYSPTWGTPLIADGKVYVGDEDGDLVIFKHSSRKTKLNEIYMEDSIKMTPIAVDDTLYIGTLGTLYAISKKK